MMNTSSFLQTTSDFSLGILQNFQNKQFLLYIAPLPEQVFPFLSNKNPLLHSQTQLPFLFLHCCSQPPFDISHSLSSENKYLGNILGIIQSERNFQLVQKKLRNEYVEKIGSLLNDSNHFKHTNVSLKLISVIYLCQEHKVFKNIKRT